MDQTKIIPLMTKKHGIRIAADDPVWATGTVIEEAVKDAVTQLQKMLTEQLDQISAANAMAENAAKAKGERLITEGADWAAKKIQEAGETVAARIVAEAQKELADAKKQLNRATAAVWFAAAAAACAAVGAVAVMWL
jgi:hypothetical protein